MSYYTALLDANVLYPAPIRDIFLQLAQTGLFKAKWSQDIHREWTDALLRNEPYRDRARIENTRNLMNSAVRDCLVTGYQDLISSLQLPDPEDRHVLAAAIVGRCDVIVTCNLHDFPEDMLAPFRLEAQHPDVFLSNHLHLAPSLFCTTIRTVRQRLRKPPFSESEYLDNLARLGLTETAIALAAHSGSL